MSICKICHVKKRKIFNFPFFACWRDPSSRMKTTKENWKIPSKLISPFFLSFFFLIWFVLKPFDPFCNFIKEDFLSCDACSFHSQIFRFEFHMEFLIWEPEELIFYIAYKVVVQVFILLSFHYSWVKSLIILITNIIRIWRSKIPTEILTRTFRVAASLSS